jgi:hypothetical protein
MNRRLLSCLVIALVSLVPASAQAGEGNPEGLPQGYKRPSFYGYYPNGVPYQNYPYYSQHGESFYYHQPYYSARPAFGGGFYHPGTRVPLYGMRPIGRGL